MRTFRHNLTDSAGIAQILPGIGIIIQIIAPEAP